MKEIAKSIWQGLSSKLEGEVKWDDLHLSIYSTDASIYQERPIGVAFPKGEGDLITLVKFAKAQQISLIPRTAGTSLAGQCVGKGLVVDTSRYMNAILEHNLAEGWIKVQPGVVRDELNDFLKPLGYFFGPNTSTANRCMIGGMVGNNSCGSTSIKYGSTRDHVLTLRTILEDGEVAVFDAIEDNTLLSQKMALDNAEGRIYRAMHSILEPKSVQENIRKHFPDASIHRRNTGYAIDLLLDQTWLGGKQPTNLCALLAGSEGTLAMTTEITLHVDPLPPAFEAVIAAHFKTLNNALKAAVLAMDFAPFACELMDKVILDCTKGNRTYEHTRFFVEGDPAALLAIELRSDTKEDLDLQIQKVVSALEGASLGYSFPVLYPPQTPLVWSLRSAGLGLLSNVPGDAKPVAFVEDTAVKVEDLPAYIEEFEAIMQSYGQRSVYYAHAGAGEIHLRPVLDLKTKKGHALLEDIAWASARLVKKYNGSLSGEHGDGRVRAQFIPFMIGDENYALLEKVKEIWDPTGLFNPGKIVKAAPITEALRYHEAQTPEVVKTIFQFEGKNGLLQMAEACNGSGDCRRLPAAGVLMCPSYMATKDEKDTTRARANALRNYMTASPSDKPALSSKELYDVMDLCVACKGCTSQCPSNVDMATMKSEFLYQYQQHNGIPFRSRLFSNIDTINRFFQPISGVFNAVSGSPFGKWGQTLIGVHSKRSLPPLTKQTVRQWFEKTGKNTQPKVSKGKICFFVDEFTNANDASIGKKAINIAQMLGFEVMVFDHKESGRAAISKGMLNHAKKIAIANVALFSDIAAQGIPIVGLEPSAILTFRHEYPLLVEPSQKAKAEQLSKHVWMMDEWLQQMAQLGHLSAEMFHEEERSIHFHAHCHQKAIGDMKSSAFIMSLPKNYKVTIIPSSCCGMAGSFGYEQEHYEVSMQMGELVLFPAVRKAMAQNAVQTIIAATGTSCRHQIKDGTQVQAMHPVEILWEAIVE